MNGIWLMIHLMDVLLHHNMHRMCNDERAAYANECVTVGNIINVVFH